ncbi:MAG: hypothetical protein HXS41_00875 [Theionarchaea archaeon]|nr:hypothetical protein [Theionarchaea archaeon]MBU6999295.1 hypothetical protein [Theionarchaea archaeon]MBU7019580.1 hypothetical protein [Theionarchaea archaeon]MBU7033759.1 hypothetical protein [Theionarchaea archaeon]MBU7039431.1 hypothetical protein [Theionarchaea archaeon]
MNRWIYVLICVLVVGSASVVAYYGYTHTEPLEPAPEPPSELALNLWNFSVMRETNEQVRKEIGFRIFAELSQEEMDQAQDIAQSDAMVAAILQQFGEQAPEVFGGPSGKVAILRYSSEEWVAQVTVDLEEREVVAVTLNKGILPPTDVVTLIHLAEREVPVQAFGTPLLRKISSSGEGAEVVFLTDKGTVEIRVNGEQGRVVRMERTPRSLWEEYHLRWLWVLIPISTAVLILVFWAISRKTPPGEETESLPETEAGTEPGSTSE